MESPSNGHPKTRSTEVRVNDRIPSDAGATRKSGEQVRWFGYIAVGIAVVSGLVGIALVVYLVMRLFR